MRRSWVAGVLILAAVAFAQPARATTPTQSYRLSPPYSRTPDRSYTSNCGPNPGAWVVLPTARCVERVSQSSSGILSVVADVDIVASHYGLSAKPEQAIYAELPRSSELVRRVEVTAAFDVTSVDGVTRPEVGSAGTDSSIWLALADGQASSSKAYLPDSGYPHAGPHPRITAGPKTLSVTFESNTPFSPHTLGLYLGAGSYAWVWPLAQKVAEACDRGLPGGCIRVYANAARGAASSRLDLAVRYFDVKLYA